ncbi:phage tail spike protein, partial [Caenibacillus caldisaponilyticus]|uniref:phage tail spike protein n=1 Tax=Caenibacillus caldisaponilyticus TaxID=1674942 RepID=UPI001EE71079
MTQGYHLLKQGNDGYFYLYRIYDWEDSAVGPVHVKRVQAMNRLAWDLTHKIVPARTFTNANSQQAFEYILQQTGWEIGENDFFGGEKKLEFSAGNTAQYWLDQLTQQFGVEIRAYVQVYNGQVIRKLVDIVEELGESEGRRLEYSRDLLGITRSGTDQEMYTKLYVYGGTDSKGNIVSIASVNDGKDYIVDDDANDIYNDGGPYLEGYIVNDQ